MNAVASFQSLNPSSSSSSLPISHFLLPTSSVLPRIFPPETLAIDQLKNNTKKKNNNNNNIPFSSRTSFPDTRIFSRKCRLSVLNSQKRPDNSVSEDTDDMFDELLDKYGKVVYSRNDEKRPSAEVDDDAESLSFAVALANVANDVKAADIRVLFVKPLVYWTRFFIIATAFSRPQIDAIGSKIRDLAEEKFKRVPRGDTKPNSWTLLDFGDVVVHIFLPQQRAYYNLEEFYGNATTVELPFENQNQTPFRS